jgi:predicted nucleic-acid-binding Zn-ribbon protein
MKRGECTKCGSNEVYVRESTVGEFGSFQSNTLPVTLFTNAIFENFVCTACGFVERYIKEQSKLEKIKEKWSKYKE